MIGIVLGSLGATAIILVGFEIMHWLHVRAARRSPPAPPPFDVRAERFRLLRAQCRDDCTGSSQEDDTRPMEIHVEVADD